MVIKYEHCLNEQRTDTPHTEFTPLKPVPKFALPRGFPHTSLPYVVGRCLDGALTCIKQEHADSARVCVEIGGSKR
jgi:hypothetical protein